jgi:integrase
LPRENTPSPDDVRTILDAADRLAAEGKWERVQRDAVWLIALTAQRRAEVAAMDWSEIDLLKAVWVQPAHKNKTKPIRSRSGRWP